MTYWSVACVLLGGSFPAVWQASDKATFDAKTAAEWVEMLERDSSPAHRRAALLALGMLGPMADPKVVPAVATTLQKDKEAGLSSTDAPCLASGSWCEGREQERL